MESVRGKAEAILPQAGIVSIDGGRRGARSSFARTWLAITNCAYNSAKSAYADWPPIAEGRFCRFVAAN